MRWYITLLWASTSFAQGIITTVAGTDWIFPDSGKAGVQARIAGPNNMALDQQGNLFFAVPDLNMVMRLDTKGIVTVVAGNGLQRFAGDGGPAIAASLAAPQGVGVDGTGSIYIADTGNNRIRKVDSAGNIATVAGGGGPYPGDGLAATQAALRSPVAVAFDASGNMLIDEFPGRLRKVDAKGILTTIAGNGTQVFSGDGGPAANATLNIPVGIAVAADGTIYIADHNDSCVRKITSAGIISTVAGRGNDFNSTGIPGTTAGIAGVAAVAVDSQGNVYIAEDGGARVRRLSPNGTLTIIAGTGQSGFSGDGGSATKAQLALPSGLAVDAAGNVFVGDHDNSRIRRIDTSGIITTVVGAGAFTGDGGPATAARFAIPQGIAVDSQGNLYVADPGAESVRKVGPDGVIATFAGTGRASSGGPVNNTPAAGASLNQPHAVAVDAQGNVFIADSGSNVIRKVDSTGTITTIADGNSGLSYPTNVAVDSKGNIYCSKHQSVGGDRVQKIVNGVPTVIAGDGTAGSTGDGGLAVNAQISNVSGLAVDAAGNIYIADGPNSKVRRVDPNGIITTFAGNGQFGDSGDGGPATSAMLAGAAGLAVDSAGNLYIATSNRVRRVTPAGIITAFAGTGSGGFSGDGGFALASAMSGTAPGLAVSSQGNLYIADFNNKRIRLVQATGGPSLVTSQNGLTFIASTGGGAPAPQTFTIVNGGQGTLSWGASASTLSGGKWLSVTPANGASPAGLAGPPVQMSVNPAGLALGDYYGQIQILAPGAPNSPQSVTIVLSVRNPGDGTGSIVQPSGLLFTAAPGGAAPPSQSFSMLTLSNAPVTFTGTASFGGPAWFTLAPASGTTVTAKPATVQIVPNITGLAAGVYNGNITFAFADNAIQNVQLLLVLSTGGTARPNAPGVRPAACTPSKLLPLFTSVGPGFNLTTGWPSPIELRIVDDCSQPLTRGSVTASFSNTDPSLTLNSLGDGRWTGTWIAQNTTSSVSVTANAQTSDKSLTGSSQVNGGLSKNANPPPVVAQGGVLNAASYQLQGALAPGSLISIFGTQLAQGSVPAPGLPLASTLGGTTVTIAGRSLPLLFAGPNQVNAQVPFDLPINATHQLVVQRGTAISIPQPISVLSSQGGVFTKDLTGQGAAIVVRVAADGSQSVVATDNPAHAYEALVIYCAGLGDVDPRQIAGQQATFSPLSQTLDPAKVTIGGIDAPVFFAGLTPGFTGLYQVNAYVPTGVAPGDNVQLIITQAGRTSPPVLISVR